MVVASGPVVAAGGAVVVVVVVGAAGGPVWATARAHGSARLSRIPEIKNAFMGGSRKMETGRPGKAGRFRV